MITVGQVNALQVIKEVSFGVYLDGEDWGEILLPKKFVPQGIKIKDTLDVFIYFDSDDKIIATTLRPRAMVGSCAFLKVVDVNRVGAFLDWGLDKDKSYLVYVKQDDIGRIVASSKLDYCLDKSTPHLKAGDEVHLLIAETSDLGTKVIINDRYWGLIHAADIFQALRYGERTKGYIKKVRDDGKMDVVLRIRKVGQDRIRDLAERILLELHKQGGFLPLHDKSTSLVIMRAFSESKKSFKSAIGQLYKQGEIRIESDGIRSKDKRS